MFILRGSRIILAFAIATFLILCQTGFSSFGQTPGADGAQSASSGLNAGQELNLGVDSYKTAHYDEAITHFRRALELNPKSHVAKIYLATALAQNVMPGLDTPDNLKIAQEAIDIFLQVLESDPHDVNSMKQVAGICYQIKKLDNAKAWQKNVLDQNPNDPEAAYTIGVIDWEQAHQNKLKALGAAGFVNDGQGNVEAPGRVMEQLISQNKALVDEGLKYLTMAINNRANYDEAMAYLNLMYRNKADVDYGNPDAVKADIAAADGWTIKAMETRKKNESSRQPSPASGQP